jgi:hypothetical protein
MSNEKNHWNIGPSIPEPTPPNKIREFELEFSPDGSKNRAHWVPFGSILESGMPIVGDDIYEDEQLQEYDDQVFMNRIRLDGVIYNV